MSVLGDFITEYSNQITVIIAIILALYGFWKWLRKENTSAVTILKKQLLGEKEDGTGGIIGAIQIRFIEEMKELKEQNEKDMQTLKKELLYEVQKFQTDLNNQHAQSVIDVRYIKRDINRMERSLEKLTGGKYTMAKVETHREDYDNDKNDEL